MEESIYRFLFGKFFIYIFLFFLRLARRPVQRLVAPQCFFLLFCALIGFKSFKKQSRLKRIFDFVFALVSVFIPTPVRWRAKTQPSKDADLLSVGLRSCFSFKAVFAAERCMPDCVDFYLAVRGQARTCGNQITHDNVFLETG